MQEEKIRKMVRKGYGKMARETSSCCGPQANEKLGYTKKELKSLPEGATVSFGCGNPVAVASLKEGETVLDLGAGFGLDCFLAANKVGKKGKIIGVDMTPEMIDRARENARKGKYQNVEFRLGEIENLPVADNSVDVIISNCVINLSPDKKRVFREAFRVLKPGGRLMISDIVLLKELPEAIAESIEAYVGCVSGAVMKKDYVALIKDAGFEKVKVLEETQFPIEFIEDDPTVKDLVKKLDKPVEELKEVAASVSSVKVYGIKPD